jgi:hypothetical protein
MEVDAAKCDERTAQQNVTLATAWSTRFLGSFSFRFSFGFFFCQCYRAEHFTLLRLF